MSLVRRAACDRCHGQKMRCIREGSQGKCNRCLAAHAECRFGTPRKVGRPPASGKAASNRAHHSSSPNTRNSNISGDSGSERRIGGGDIVASPPSTPERPINDRRERIRQRETERAQYQERTREVGRDRGRHNHRHHSRDSLSNELENIDFSSVSSSLFEGPGSLFDDNNSQLFSFGADDFASTSDTLEGYRPTDAGPQGSWTGAHSSSYESCYPNRATSRENAFDMFMPISPSIPLTSQASQPRQNSVAGARPQQDDRPANAMQMLSELGRTLFAHIHNPYSDVNIDEDIDANPENLAAQQISRLERLTANVIESSRTFDDILRNSPDLIACDTATTLLILTTYIRLIQLHHALYAHMQSLLIRKNPTFSSPVSASSSSSPFSFSNGQISPPPSTSASSRSHLHLHRDSPPEIIPVPFPTLEIGSVSLAAYPRFQLKFILQVCTHHLGEVEALLGLPDGFCVSDRGDENKGGILQRSAGGTLVQTVMIEASEIVKGIRKILADLVRKLRGSIQI